MPSDAFRCEGRVRPRPRVILEMVSFTDGGRKSHLAIFARWGKGATHEPPVNLGSLATPGPGPRADRLPARTPRQGPHPPRRRLRLRRRAPAQRLRLAPAALSTLRPARLRPQTHLPPPPRPLPGRRPRRLEVPAKTLRVRRI